MQGPSLHAGLIGSFSIFEKIWKSEFFDILNGNFW